MIGQNGLYSRHNQINQSRYERNNLIRNYQLECKVLSKLQSNFDFPSVLL